MTYDMTDLQADGAQDTGKLSPELTSRSGEPRTAAGRLLVDTISEYQGEPDDGQWTRRIRAIEAEAAGAPPLSQHGELREALQRLVAKWDEDGYYVEKEDYDMARAALTARQPAPEPFYDSDGIPIPDELFAAMEPASPERSDPAPLDVEQLLADLREALNYAGSSMLASDKIRSIIARLTARAEDTE